MEAALLPSFDSRTDHRLMYRRIGLCAQEVTADDGVFALLSFFVLVKSLCGTDSQITVLKLKIESLIH